jgi:hypothetical protein
VMGSATSTRREPQWYHTPYALREENQTASAETSLSRLEQRSERK